MEQAKDLSREEFSSPLLAKAYGQLTDRYKTGLELNLAVLEDFTSEEMSHLAGILLRQDGPVNENALRDCIRTIRSEHQAGQVTSDDDLLAYRNKLKDKKGLKV